MRKRLLSILLLCCMVLTLLPTAAFAGGDGEIYVTNFPDKNLLKYVNYNFDTDSDVFVFADESGAVEEITLAL